MKAVLALISIFIMNKTMAQDRFSVLLYTQHDDWFVINLHLKINFLKR